MMMVARPDIGEEAYTDSELGEEEEYSDELVDEFETEEVFVPKTFEDFQTMFHQQFEPADESEEPLSEEPLSLEASSPEPQSVDHEMEQRVEQELLKMPESANTKKSPEPESDEGPMSQEEDYDPDDQEDLSGDKNPPIKILAVYT